MKKLTDIRLTLTEDAYLILISAIGDGALAAIRRREFEVSKTLQDISQAVHEHYKRDRSLRGV